MGDVARYVGAVLLALLGVGFFPFSTRALATSGGLLIAGLSVLLIFFAYRVWPKSSPPVQAARAPVGSLPQGWPTKEEASPPQPSAEPAYPFSLNMPDITKSAPVSLFNVGNQVVVFHKDPPPAAARAGVEMPLRYIYTGTVLEPDAGTTLSIFTLETGFTDATFFCVFDRLGARINLGDGTALRALHAFEAAVLDRACQAAGLPPEAAQRVGA